MVGRHSQGTLSCRRQAWPPNDGLASRGYPQLDQPDRRCVVSTERRYYSSWQLERAAQQIELWRDQQALAYRRDLWDLAKTEGFAAAALERPERFSGEHSVARTYLEIDVPRRRRWLDAGLLILEFGSAKLRAKFVLSDDATRER